MDVITFEKNAYLTLIKKIDEIYQELQRLKTRRIILVKNT